MLQSLTAAVTGRTEPNEQNGRDGFTFRVAHVKRNGTDSRLNDPRLNGFRQNSVNGRFEGLVVTGVEA